MALKLEGATTQDVRREWIQAVFGTDFPCKGNGDTSIDVQSLQRSRSKSGNTNNVNTSNIISSWKGVGLANIPNYTTYTVELRPSQENRPSAPLHDNDEKKEASPQRLDPSETKLGMTLSRLTLGLYVRHVHPGSEAWCAGVQSNSVLVSINHGTINLLAEPTKAALERLWQYEGLAEETAQISSAMIVREPISMTFILHGKTYDVIFLSNPPYGIDWAPCGNFCLVKKVTSQEAKNAGIQPSSIIASISTLQDQTAQNIYTLDHVSAAEALRKAVASNPTTLQLQFCFSPANARSGAWERSEEMKEGDNKRNAHNASKSTSKRHGTSSLEKTKFTMDWDGIQVRIHPLLGENGGILRRSLSTPNFRDPSLVSLSHLAAQVATGDPFPLNLISYKTRSWRHGNDETTRRGSDSMEKTQRYSQVTQHGRLRDRSNYRPCPSLERPILDCWNIEQALTYICRLHLVHYNENEQLFSAPEVCCAVDMLKMDSATIEKDPVELATTFLIFWMSWLTKKDDDSLSEPHPLFELGQKHVLSLAHPMEYLSLAFGNETIQQRLKDLRKNRVKATHRHRALHQQPQNLLFNTGGSTIKRQPVDVIDGTSSVSGATLDRAKCAAGEYASGSDNERNRSNTNCSSAKAMTPKRRFRFFRKKKSASRFKNRLDPSLDTKVASVEAAVSEKPSNRQPQPPQHTGVPKAMKNSEDISAYPSGLQPRAGVALLDALIVNSFSFISELEVVCESIEKSLMQSFSQKFARWALQPWTSSKETALAEVTRAMREHLKICTPEKPLLPLLNPVDSSELFLSIDTSECYVLPSAHFPLLLTFDSQKENLHSCQEEVSTRPKVDQIEHFSGQEVLYRTSIELVSLRGTLPTKEAKSRPSGFTVHGSVSGAIVESGASTKIDKETCLHVWDTGNFLVFDSRSSWGPPRTLTLRLDSAGDAFDHEKGIGYCWIDLTSFWEKLDSQSTEKNCFRVTARFTSSGAFKDFDEHGCSMDFSPEAGSSICEDMELELRISPKFLATAGMSKTSLLYKHDDDVRQEMFAIEFLKSCDRVLRSCGLDMKMLLYRCIAVGKRQGFIEWVHGSVPISEICLPSLAGTLLGRREKERDAEFLNTDGGTNAPDDATLSSVAKAGLAKYQSHRLMNPQSRPKTKQTASLVPMSNPIQDFFRSCAYDGEAPYHIKKEVMDNYVKSCAGYSVCTFLLGVGDRHLDNLLLRQSGHFFHCDYSFILGKDPKKHLPMRITEEMINAMGGWKSDNYLNFSSLCSAVYLTLRRPENVRHLLSLVRLMQGCDLPDLEVNQTLETAMEGIRQRLHLDFTDEEAISFMETLIEQSCSSRIWMAVDAIHSFAQRF